MMPMNPAKPTLRNIAREVHVRCVPSLLLRGYRSTESLWLLGSMSVCVSPRKSMWVRCLHCVTIGINHTLQVARDLVPPYQPTCAGFAK
eukprot:848166-Amphidinium_carterae.1